MRKLILIIIVNSCLHGLVNSQDNSILNTVIENFNKQVLTLPQEKIYLHTDKPWYISGEKIFFRAHLTDAVYHIPVTVSRYVYIELINPLDELVTRVKIRPEDNNYSGHIVLPEDIPEGYYTVRAYTKFMQNAGEHFFFKKNIRIGDPNSRTLQTASTFEQGEKNRITMTLTLTEKGFENYISPAEIKVNVNQEKQYILTRDDDNKYRLTFTLPPGSKKRQIYVETEHKKRYHRQYIPIPYEENTFNVSFFPEGGNLLTDVPCNIGFKALSTNGLSTQITGTIYDQEGSEIVKLKSIHLGMGYFSFIPQKGKKYYATCTDSNGTTLNFDLPVGTDKGCTLNTRWVKDKLWLSVKKSDNQPLPESLFIIAHIRGTVLFADEWSVTDESLYLDKKDFPSGVMHILLFDKNLSTLSERLVFIANDDQAKSTIKPNKENYKQRELVNLNISVTDRFNTPLEGDFSLSVTDDKEIAVDTCNTIYTHLLLTSDLRGHIENPSSYFNQNDRNALAALDHLMMTQGWRRYNIPEIIAGKIDTIKIPLEESQKISGLVKGGVLMNKPTEGLDVTLISSASPGWLQTKTTNKEGQFVFDNFEFPDSTNYFIQALNKKGTNRVELLLHPEEYPEITPPGILWGSEQQNQNNKFLEFLTKEDMRYVTENGPRVIELDEVNVYGDRKRKINRSAYVGAADQSLQKSDFGTTAGRTVLDLLSKYLPAVTVSATGEISIRGGSTPLILVNDIEIDPEFLKEIDADIVEQIDLLHASQFLGQRSANGVISITIEDISKINKKETFNIKGTSPLGFQQPIEFYSPVYNTPEAKENPYPDLRTTIYWKPNIKISQEDKTARVEFYTADTPSTYTIVIEGVTTNGQIIYQKNKIYLDENNKK